MSGLPYQGGLNSQMFDISQYGVNMQSPSASVASGLGGLASAMPFIGPILGAGLNIYAQQQQNAKQEAFFEQYMSPQARMAQMRAAGINPNAAAQGISGASAPQMNAAAPTGAFSSLGEQLGNSVNNALSAKAISAGIDKTNAETDLTNSLNVEKQTTNKYLDAMQNATLRNLVNQGNITEHQANIIAVDDTIKVLKLLHTLNRPTWFLIRLPLRFAMRNSNITICLPKSMLQCRLVSFLRLRYIRCLVILV